MTSWYNSAWKERAPVAINFNAGAGAPPPGASNIDWELSIPSTWSRFWDNILVSGFDVILTDAHNNLLTFRRRTYTHATQSLILEVDNMPAFDNAMNGAWLYWNNPAAADAASVFVGAALKTGIVYIGGPSGRVVQTIPSRPSSDTPSTVFQKTDGETVFIWFSLQGLFGPRIDASQKRKFLESIKYCNVFSYNAAGTHDPARVVANSTRFINGWVAVQVTAGVNGTDYTVSLEIMTTEDQILTPRCLLQVRNLLPPA